MSLLTGDAMAAQLASIYEAAVAPDKWMDVLVGLRNNLRLTFATIAAYPVDRTSCEARVAGIEQADYDRFLEKYFLTNEFSTETASRTAGSVVPSRSFIDPGAFRRSEMYQEFHRNRDMGEGLRLDIWQGGGSYRSIACFRPWECGPYETLEIDLCRTLMPHLQRAATIGQRLRQADLLAEGARATLEVLPQPIFLLDCYGGIQHINQAGQGLLRLGEGLSVIHNHLHATDAASAERLGLALLRANGRHGRPPSSTALRLARRTGAPLALLVAPFRSDASFGGSGIPAVLVCVTDPDESLPFSQAHLIGLFGLTEAEASLANDLLSGQDLQDIAVRRGRSVHTLRSHLARLMAKTNVTRQSALMRLLATLPRFSGLA